MNDFLSFVSAGILLCIKTILAIILWLYLVIKYPEWIVMIATIAIVCYLIKEYYKFFNFFK